MIVKSVGATTVAAVAAVNVAVAENVAMIVVTATTVMIDVVAGTIEVAVAMIDVATAEEIVETKTTAVTEMIAVVTATMIAVVDAMTVIVLDVAVVAVTTGIMTVVVVVMTATMTGRVAIVMIEVDRAIAEVDATTAMILNEMIAVVVVMTVNAMVAESAKGVMTKPGAVDVGRAAKNAERVQMIVRRVEMPQRSETTIEEKALMDVERVRTGKRKTRKIRRLQKARKETTLSLKTRRSLLQKSPPLKSLRRRLLGQSLLRSLHMTSPKSESLRRK
jgi:hypothetical protein